MKSQGCSLNTLNLLLLFKPVVYSFYAHLDKVKKKYYCLCTAAHLLSVFTYKSYIRCIGENTKYAQIIIPTQFSITVKEKVSALYSQNYFAAGYFTVRQSEYYNYVL